MNETAINKIFSCFPIFCLQNTHEDTLDLLLWQNYVSLRLANINIFPDSPRSANFENSILRIREQYKESARVAQLVRALVCQ